jgi:type I restriction-modification system DNA methylase subunit
MEKKHPKKDLETAIEKMAIGGNNNFADCFHNFLDLALSYFCNNINERQMALRKRVEENEDFRKAYQEALEAYGDCAENYQDPMGDMFMEKISHGQHGQFFTPEDLCELSAEIILGNDFYDGMTINDPTSGSGRMLLKALQIAREVHGKEPLLYANDLSMTCAKMCLLNFLVNSVDGEVTCGDALKLDWENFTFFKIDKVRNIATGAVFSTYWQYTTADVEKVQEKRQKWFEWVFEYGWVKYKKYPSIEDLMDSYVSLETNDEEKHDENEEYSLSFELGEEITKESLKETAMEYVKDDPLPTEIKMGEQLSLFD